MISLSENINPNKVFLINRSELEGKLEVGYYSPEINQIEKKIRRKSTKLLRDFIVRLSSGATPSVQDEAKFYSDEKNGIPFLRVQNLCTNGKLDLSNVRYINKETHENYLKRSQVSGGDLLVKITGVGRMAIASVAPEGFVGNTNQHMVVIKTKSREVSEYLANYLNLDIIEKIASRKATGATRPALDYTALKSIPIVEGLDFSLLAEAERKKEQKEAEAKALLESIDTYVLKELGISLPEQNNTLQDRIFTAKFSEVVGLRFDPFYFKHFGANAKSHLYTEVSLKSVASIVKGQSITKDKVVEGDYPVIAGGQSSPYNHNVYNQEPNVITVSASGAYAGFVWFHTQKIFASDCSVIRSKDESAVSTEFIYNVLKAKQAEIYRMQQGAGQPHVYSRDLEKLTIPLPLPSKQAEINEHIKNIKSQINTLNNLAQSIVEDAKKNVERMIIGK